MISKNQMTSNIFQSTHPTRECDKYPGTVPWHLLHFNPRTLQESATATIVNDIKKVADISIHAPYKRVRLKRGQIPYGGKIISIHAPYKRVRPQYIVKK